MQLLTAQQQQQQQFIAAQVATLLQNVSVTFAQINYTTQVKTAAAHNALLVQKTVNANVQLFSNINAYTSVYANAVKKSAQQFNNNANAVNNFTAQSNYYTHTNCYSICTHNATQHLYLYCIFNSVQSSAYTINNANATTAQVAALLTNSAAQQLLNKSNTVHNATHNITHNVQVRTIALHNINSINALKQQLVFNNN